jgi:UDP-glucose 4-epimerase
MVSFEEIQAKLRGSRVIVTGGTGFIGSHLVERLVAIGGRVRVLTRTENTEYLTSVTNKIELRKCDLINKNEVKAALEGAEYVFHLAALIPKQGTQYDNPVDSIEANILPTANICDAILTSSNFKKLVAASTTEVYGIPQKSPVTEEHPANPLTFYGASKLAAEKLMQIYHRRYNLDVAILRYSVVFGQREGAYIRAIPNFIRSILNKEVLKIYGSGHQIRNYIYVDDAVEYTLRAIGETPSMVYNVGGINTSIIELVKIIAALTKSEIRVEHVALDSRQYDFILDSSRIEKELEYHAQTPMEVGLSREIQWYSSIQK